MSRRVYRGLVVIFAVVVAVTAYYLGRRSAMEAASAHLYDVSAHLLLSSVNEQVIALTQLRDGKTDEAIRGLELLVTAKLEQIDADKVATTIVASKSLQNLRAPLVAYQTQFPMTTIDSKKNPKLEPALRGLK